MEVGSAGRVNAVETGTGGKSDVISCWELDGEDEDLRTMHRRMSGDVLCASILFLGVEWWVMTGK